MQLTIIGAGAIGGTIGAYMAREGHEVTLCDIDQAHVDEINRHGLTIEGPVAHFNVKIRAITPDQLAPRLDRVAVAVKSHHTSDAAELLRGRLAEGGYCVSFQNGLTADVLADAVGRENLLVSFVNFGADVVGPGRIMQGNVATFRVGEPYVNEITPRVLELVEALPFASATDNILGYLWGKEAYGAMLYAGAVSDLSIADHLGDPRYRTLMKAIAAEVLAQAPVRPEGFDGFEPDDLEVSLDRLVAFNRQSAKTHSGIYRDLMVRKRKTEVDDLLRDLHGPLTNHVGALIQSIERGERTCEVANLDLLAAYERALRVDEKLHALVRTLPAPVRSASGPLHGIQVAVKDMIDVRGEVRGNGNPNAQRENAPAVQDAPVITALREAGADVFALTNLLEYAAGALHPGIAEAMNPYDPRTTAGGSSGGSAALVGAQVCRAALGTDSGGSIRIPAHYCGVVGFKPSFGAVPIEGVEALSPTLDHVGVLASDVETAQRVFAVIASRALAARDDGRVRVGFDRRQIDDPVSTESVRAAMETVLTLLDEHVDLVEVDAGALDAIRPTFDAIVLYEAWQVHGTRVTQNPHHYGPETLRLLEAGAQVSRESYEAAMEERLRLLPLAREVYRDVDVLLTPSTPYVAPATTPPMDTAAGAVEAYFTGPLNLTGAPAIVLPIALDDQGLPIGAQFSAPRGSDDRLLEVARQLESFIGFTPRPVVA